MDCRRIEEKLPAYLEGVLPPDEGKLVEEHVAACPNCRRALEDLVKADKLIRDLAEAEPPPWLKQKIMAKVREERERREGFFRRLFYPLHIKIPATALATVLIAVFAVYVFRAVEPEMRYLHETPSAPVPVTPEKKVAEPPIVPAPKAAVPAIPGDRERPAVSETDRESGRKLAATEEKKASPGPEQQAAAERKISERMDAAPAAPAATRMQKAPVAKSALPPAEKGETRFGAAMKDEMRAPAVAAKVKTEAPEGYSFSLYVKDPALAVNDVESLLAGYGARKITKEFRDGRGLITAEVEAGKTKEIFQRLKSLGEVREKGKVTEYPAGPVAMKIEVLAAP
jgi:anti-sigma factor RsiW